MHFRLMTRLANQRCQVFQAANAIEESGQSVPAVVIATTVGKRCAGVVTRILLEGAK